MQGVARLARINTASFRRSAQLLAKPHEKLVTPVQVRGRKHLPDCDNTLLPEYLSDAKEDGFFGSFEVQSQPTEERLQWAQDVRKEVEEKLGEYGAVLMRDTPLKTGKDFSEFIRLSGWQTKGDDDFARAMQSRSMTSTCISEFARTASDDHHNYTIEPHHEYHTVAFPNLILLFCESCPEAGGEWPVGNGRQILRELRPEVIEKFERLGARYSLFYPSKNSPDGARYNNWETNLLPTKEETESYLRDRGYEVEWGADNSLRYWQNFPAVRVHPKTGERVWFNQIHAHHKSFYECHPAFDGVQADIAGKDQWPVDCTYGDGTPIEQETLDHIREIVWRNCVGVTPRQGDLLICDNWLALHGRISFPKGQRHVFAATVFQDFEEDDEE
eukprot:TRINITY_DN5904_c0_g1_i1.p1 TRINITY_DN5904_c0_g1~~TRINITY_DN5904_c0_g1_i1.p1  ORF type:complete len:407 (+),score=170.42 TRINITY_DN5904_c0_g1_i1:63-1223(+)